MPGPFHHRITPTALALALAAALAGSGCGREQIRAYEVPKETPPAQLASAAGGAPALPPELASLPPMPGLEWPRLPDGWDARGPSGMRAGTFTMAGPDDGVAELAVIPLPGTGGSDLELVNLWRRQVNLDPVGEAALAAHTEAITVAGGPAKLFEIVQAGDTAAAGQQILVVALAREGTTWFFKLSGDAPTVAAHREKLKAFLEIVRFTAAARPELAAGRPNTTTTTAAPAAGGSALPDWTVPADWRSEPPTQMVLARWAAGDTGAPGVVITVSAFPGDVGGLLANVNRWRREVGLAEITAAELPANTGAVTTTVGAATLVDLRGTDAQSGRPARLIAAVVPQGGQTWFYKLKGDEAAAEEQKAAFVQFVQSARYAGG